MVQSFHKSAIQAYVDGSAILSSRRGGAGMLLLVPGKTPAPTPPDVPRVETKRPAWPLPHGEIKHAASPIRGYEGYTAYSVWKSIHDTTNNISELQAIELALDKVEDLNCDRSIVTPIVLEIMTDSQWAQGILEKGWKVNANREHVERIKVKIAAFRTAGHSVSLNWVRGHCGLPGNDAAHKLAQQGTASCPA